MGHHTSMVTPALSTAKLLVVPCMRAVRIGASRAEKGQRSYQGHLRPSAKQLKKNNLHNI